MIDPRPASSPPFRETLRGTSLAMLAISALLFLLAGGSAALTLRFLRSAEVGIAEVLTSEEHRGRSRVWVSTLSLTAPDGRRVTASWTGDPPMRAGQAVPVLYRRDMMWQLRPDDPWSIWRWPILFASLGAGWMLAGLGAVVASRLLPPDSAS